MVQRYEGLRLIQPDDGGKDVFHITAVERGGMSHWREGHKISYEIVADKQREVVGGKPEAGVTALVTCLAMTLRARLGG